MCCILNDLTPGASHNVLSGGVLLSGIRDGSGMDHGWIRDRSWMDQGWIRDESGMDQGLIRDGSELDQG